MRTTDDLMGEDNSKKETFVWARKHFRAQSLEAGSAPPELLTDASEDGG